MSVDPQSGGPAAAERSSAPPGPGRRERRKAETRARLLEAARALFVEQGYDATRPQQVAERADVAVGTFYAHFGDKSGAFLAFTEQAALELMERMRRAPAGGFDARLRSSLEALLAYHDENPGVLKAAFADAAVIAADLPPEASLRSRFARSLAQGLRQGIADGSLSPDLDPEVAAHGIVGFVGHVLAYGQDAKLPRERLVESATRMLARAVGVAADARANGVAAGGGEEGS